MSVAQNLIYSIVQVAHNFGAVAAVGSSIAAIKYRDIAVRHKLAWLGLAGWGAQAISGAAFGAVSYYFYHQFPDISEVAAVALVLKIGCAITGLLLLSAYLLQSEKWTVGTMNGIWVAVSALAGIALVAAAFLRWFS